ncbi:hypothetical protein PTKIN_Ptkin15bG0084500 [Pterospermum kingtungense]
MSGAPLISPPQRLTKKDMDEGEASEMEVEEQLQPVHNNQSLTNRLGLKNSIQTYFGDDYVFQIVPKDDWGSMAVSLSTNAVKLYSPMTGQCFGECKRHSSTINHISFSGASTPHILHSPPMEPSGLGMPGLFTSAGSSQEVFSFSFGGSDDNLLAAGCQSQIFFWDWRNKKQVACLEESHVEDVTQVHFIPGYQNKLASASADGLMCIFDTNDDDHLESLINVGTSIGKVGFFGDISEKLWCLTNIETLRLIILLIVTALENLWVIGGTNAGSVGYFPVKYKGAAAVEPPEAVLGGGHMGVVRSIIPMSSMRSGYGLAQSRGIFGWTGGEDRRLCCWMADYSPKPEVNRSWISSALVIKSPPSRKKCRHHPY